MLSLLSVALVVRSLHSTEERRPGCFTFKPQQRRKDESWVLELSTEAKETFSRARTGGQVLGKRIECGDRSRLARQARRGHFLLRDLKAVAPTLEERERGVNC